IIASPQRKLDPSTPVLRFSWLPDAHVCGLHRMRTVDGSTADIYRHDMAFLGAAATGIINEVRGINRVVYDVTSKPPGTIEWE
ncbi:hypothetical protein NKJ81_25140, partial [Mesorhizobium sp. M0018]